MDHRTSDKAQWVDDATGLDCLIVRAAPTGSLCGYVGVPPGHPWHGQPASDVDGYAHGGLNFASLCQEGAEDGYGVCHVPEPGRPAEVWWLGFDCSHCDDVSPTMDAELIRLGIRQPESVYATALFLGQVYRTFDYVRGEVTNLAAQVLPAHVR